MPVIVPSSSPFAIAFEAASTTSSGGNTSEVASHTITSSGQPQPGIPVAARAEMASSPLRLMTTIKHHTRNPALPPLPVPPGRHAAYETHLGALFARYGSVYTLLLSRLGAVSLVVGHRQWAAEGGNHLDSDGDAIDVKTRRASDDSCGGGDAARAGCLTDFPRRSFCARCQHECRSDDWDVCGPRASQRWAAFTVHLSGTAIAMCLWVIIKVASLVSGR